MIVAHSRLSGSRDGADWDGRVAAVEPSLAPDRARHVPDVSGLDVTPGPVDIHNRLLSTTGIPGAWVGEARVHPDSFSFRWGINSMVNAGGSGWRNFESFHQTSIDRARNQVLAVINIAGLGMLSEIAEQGDFDPAEVVRLARMHRDVVVCVRSAHYHGAKWNSADSAVTACRNAGIPLTADFGRFLPGTPSWELVGEHLRSGDLATHYFQAQVSWTDRGVQFDVGHGAGSFAFRNAALAVAQGFIPDSISTDLHARSMNAAMMGMPLEAVVLASTWIRAQLNGRPNLGHFSLGTAADFAVLLLEPASLDSAMCTAARNTGLSAWSPS